ncbi:MAG TPA: hypothetical protein VGO90_16650 [Chthoniobacteraceae bacterium]|jgi:hypothetical protein|nr:hypothetical protein [Chthoniobacteraceae bacterium]
MQIAVLNPGGNDPEQNFPDRAGAPDDRAHPPVNYHGFAACTAGTFHRKDQTVPTDCKAVLLLLRYNLKACRQALIELRRAGKTVAISFKESGAFQIAALLAKPSNLALFHEICARADAAIATTPDTLPFYRAGGVRYVEFIPTPYPVDDERWNFAVPFEERRGIFIGTREFDIPSRNHLAALLSIKQLAEPMQEPVTVFNVDGWSGRRMLNRLRYPEGLLNVVEGPISYPRFLRLLAKHKLVFQLDASAVPGQVAGDALLCRVPCIGGNGTTERLAFPDLCGHGRGTEQLFDLAARLLEHPHDSAAVMEGALSLARERLSFGSVAGELEKFFARLAR